MSLDDCISDVLAEPVCAKDYGKRWSFNGDTMFVHKGALERAEWLRQAGFLSSFYFLALIIHDARFNLEAPLAKCDLFYFEGVVTSYLSLAIQL